jgi:hypothetical protein
MPVGWPRSTGAVGR